MDPEDLRMMLGPECNVSMERLQWLCRAIEQAMELATRRSMRLHLLKYHTAMACFGDVFDPDIGTEEWRKLRAS